MFHISFQNAALLSIWNWREAPPAKPQGAGA